MMQNATPVSGPLHVTRNRIWAIALTVSLSVAGALAVGGLHASPAAASTAKYDLVRNVTDSYSRTVPRGVGQAPLGGRYASSPNSSFSVSHGRVLIHATPTHRRVQTMLVQVSTTDERLRGTFELPQLPSKASQLSFGLVLRRQSDGRAYYAVVRVSSTGQIAVAVLQARGGSQSRISVWTPVSGRYTAGGNLTVVAQVQGTAPVTLSVTANLAGGAGTVTAEDAGRSRITAAGRYGLWSSAPTHGAARAVQLTALTGWKLTDRTPEGGVDSNPPAPPTTTPPSTTPPSTTPPSTTPPSSTPPTTTPPTTTPSTTSGAGSAAPGDATYSIPANAVYVSSTSGSDTNPGTITAPLATVAHAVAIAPSGSTIVLRGGVYHEDVTVPAKKALTIEGYPGEAAWFDGSVPVTGWDSTTTDTGTVWAHSGWTAQFDDTPGYSPSSAAAMSWLNPAYPMAAHPDQAFLDGVPMTQVGSLDAVTTGTFYVDYSSDTLYLGSDPTGHQVAASTLTQALVVQSPNSTVRGLGVERYATPVPLMGTVALDAVDDSISDVVVTDNASQGLHLGGLRDTVDHVTASDNGLLGIHANYADGLSITNSIVDDNNDQHFATSPVAGGIKITRSRGITVSNNDVDGNDGNGLWFDESCYDMTATGNTLTNNTRMGLSVELSSTGIYADNALSNNTYDGIRITDTDNIQVWNNTFSSNNSRNLELVQDTRLNVPSTPGHDPRQPDPDPTISWVTANIQVSNNIFIAGGQFHIYAADSTGLRTASQMQLAIDGNLFSAPASQGYAPFGWGTANKTLTRYYTPAQYTAATGDGTHNTMASKQVAQATASAQTQTADDSTALPLPDAVATAIGQPTGTQHLGTF